MGDFFAFRKMMTPAIIQIVFWLGVIFSVIGGITMISTAFMPEQQFIGWAMLIIGPLAVRVYCEIFMVFFRMNDNLTEMRNHMLGAEGETRS